MNNSNNDLDMALGVKAIIEKDFYKPYTVTELAQAVGTNKSTLNFLFRKVTGMSVKQYLLWFRIEKAKELLGNTRYTIDYIAKRVGISRRNFQKQFKKVADMTPKEWRNKSNEIV
jgi:two-component system, response regulator YesN